MKKKIVSGWEEEKKNKIKRIKRRRELIIFKISHNPMKEKKKGEKIMMIKIWFRYTMNNEVFK